MLQKIIEQAAHKGGERYRSQTGLCLTADGRAVEDGHEQARYILCGPGGSIPMSLAKDLGLVSEAAAETEPETKADEAAPEKTEEKAEDSDSSDTDDTEETSEESSAETAEEEKAVEPGEDKAVRKSQAADKMVRPDKNK